MSTVEMLGSLLGLVWASGLRLYATVLLVGLGVRFSLLALPPEMEGLRVLAEPRVLTAAGMMFLVEFVADKVPWVDSLWDSVHTVIRPLGAMAMATAAAGWMDPAAKTILALLCGGVALAGHSSKAATRLLANHSPEPFSNIALSLGEDLFVLFAVWLAIQHPILALCLLAAFLAVFAWMAPKIFRLLRVQAPALAGFIRNFAMPDRIRPRTPAAAASQTATMEDRVKRVLPNDRTLAHRMPVNFLRTLGEMFPGSDPSLAFRAVAMKSVPGLRNSPGYLCIMDDRCVFVTRRSFRLRVHRIEADRVTRADYRSGIFLDRLVFHGPDGERGFYLAKDGGPIGECVALALSPAAVL